MFRKVFIWKQYRLYTKKSVWCLLNMIFTPKLTAANSQLKFSLPEITWKGLSHGQACSPKNMFDSRQIMVRLGTNVLHGLILCSNIPSSFTVKSFLLLSSIDSVGERILPMFYVRNNETFVTRNLLHLRSLSFPKRNILLLLLGSLAPAQSFFRGLWVCLSYV